MGSVHARGDTFLTFGLKALTETNTSRLATGLYPLQFVAAWLLGSRVRILLRGWMLVSCVYMLCCPA
jgi:hypothetical protein